MKKSIYILFFLTFQISVSQAQVEHLKVIKTSIFNNDENQSTLKNSFTENIFLEIVPLETVDFKNNSEGKFSFNDSKKQLFTTDLIVEKELYLTKNETVQKTKVNTINLDVNINDEFVNKVIKKKIAEEIKNYINMNEALTYGDRSLNSYKNLLELENKLIITQKITSEIEVQIGKDIYPYLKKILKSEIDKTLQNSLNLFAINF
jgi:hypothetical protein